MMIKYKIKCKDCGFEENLTKDFIKILLPSSAAGCVSGSLLWTSYFFAGTGAALALSWLSGGAVMGGIFCALQHQLKKKHKCKNCASKNFKILKRQVDEKKYLTITNGPNVVTDPNILDIEEEINDTPKINASDFSSKLENDKVVQLQKENAELQKENAGLQKENAGLQKENAGLQDNLNTEKRKTEAKNEKFKSISKNKNKRKLSDRKNKYSKLYDRLDFNDKPLKVMDEMNEDRLLVVEKIFQQLQYFPDNIKRKCWVKETKVQEIQFNHSGRLYIVRENGRINVVCIGDKKSQSKDFKFLTKNYKK